MSLLIRRITLLVLSLALAGAAIVLPAAAKNGPAAVASKCKKKGKKASGRKKKKRCGSSGRSESTLPGVPTHPTPQQPVTPSAPPAPQVNALSVTDNPVLGGRNTDGQVTISLAAPTGGQQVDLQSSDPSRASVPSAVQVASGQTAASFTVNTTAGPTTAPTITASIGGSSQNLVLNVVDKPSIVALDLDHNCYPGTGLTNYGSNRVTLDVAAPVDEAVTLQSSSPSSLSVPPSVTVPSGSKTAIFGVDTMAVTPSVTVTGTLFTSQASDTASVRDTSTPSALTGLTLSPDHVTAGNPSTGTVTLDCEALSGGSVVNLSSDNPDVTVPSTVTVQQDKLSANFQIAVAPTATGTATITASLGGTRQAVLTIDNLGT